MTIASANTAELSINQIVRQALVAVGMMAPEMPMQGSQWESRASVGREHLQLLLGQLQSKQYLLRAVENYTVTVASGDGAEATPLVLPADTLDVVGDAMWLDAGQTVESPVKQIDRETWHLYSDKTTTGRPSLMYVQKAGAVSLFLLQPPGADEAGATLRLQRQKLLANMVQAGGNTADVERSWVPWFMWSLAAFFAAGTLPIQAANARARAAEAYLDAIPAASSRLPQRATFGRWGG